MDLGKKALAPVDQKGRQMETIGFIGLGNMGEGIAGNIQKAGYPMVVHDLLEAATRPFLERGARLANSPADISRHADVTFTSLPGPGEVEEVFTGSEGLLEGAKDGGIYVDLSAGRRLSESLNPCSRPREHTSWMPR